MDNKRKKKILWLSNIDLPDATAVLELDSIPYGGWISNMIKAIAENSDFEIGVAMRSESKVYKEFKKNGITYFALPKHNTFDINQKDAALAINSFKPDLLHIEGCEMKFTKRFIKLHDGKKLFSMQGVLNGYANYELGRINLKVISKYISFRNLLVYFALIFNYIFRFLPRLRHEKEIMNNANFISGRTLWDKAQAAILAPNAIYFHCSRILRKNFYSANWSYENKELYSIFIGNSSSPRKGAHIVLESVALLKKKYPNIKIYIAGNHPISNKKNKIKNFLSYQSFLLSIIEKLSIKDNVIFTGTLDASEMEKMFMKAHVYILPSLIENSPNTLGEAMISGVPTIASYAGGSPSMARDEDEVLFYRADDAVMLAHQITRIFESKVIAMKLSQNSKERAKITHDPSINLESLIDAYKTILN